MFFIAFAMKNITMHMVGSFSEKDKVVKLVQFPDPPQRMRRFPKDVKVRNALELRTYLPYRAFMLTLNLAYRGKMVIDGTAIRIRDWRILSLLASTGPHTNREIADAMGLDSATISRAVQYLKKHQLIEARRSKRDRRMMLVMLTQKGADAHDAIAPERKKFSDEVESCLTEEEQNALYNAFDKIDAFFSARRIEHDEWE